MPVVLINPFESDAASHDEFVRSWQKAADHMKNQPGFIRTRLHRALASSARFQFVNVAEWESPQHFMAAVQSPEFQSLSQGSPPSFPALYEVVTTEEADEPSTASIPSP
ncbi:MAG TPA: antibiotic biosynthesis monooxygenase family protein [Actinomycetota bacterium]|nr:antibiotic biosynthesis monooxygenase family protein [Actinomycetota bacterium]